VHRPIACPFFERGCQKPVRDRHFWIHLRRQDAQQVIERPQRVSAYLLCRIQYQLVQGGGVKSGQDHTELHKRFSPKLTWDAMGVMGQAWRNT